MHESRKEMNIFSARIVQGSRLLTKVGNRSSGRRRRFVQACKGIQDRRARSGKCIRRLHLLDVEPWQRGFSDTVEQLQAGSLENTGIAAYSSPNPGMFFPSGAVATRNGRTDGRGKSRPRFTHNDVNKRIGLLATIRRDRHFHSMSGKARTRIPQNQAVLSPTVASC